jgi:hypothetical protein
MRRLLVVTLGVLFTATGVWFSIRAGQKQAASEAEQRVRLERKAFVAGYHASAQSDVWLRPAQRTVAEIEELRDTKALLARQRAEMATLEEEAIKELAGTSTSNVRGAGPVYVARLRQIETLRSEIADSERKTAELEKNIRAGMASVSGPNLSTKTPTGPPNPPDRSQITVTAVLTGCIYYLAMVIGIFVSSAYEGLDRLKHSARVSFSRFFALATTVGSWQGLLVSPFVFAIVRGVIPAEGISFAVVLFSFQNGFFWRSTMQRFSRSRSAAP